MIINKVIQIVRLQFFLQFLSLTTCYSKTSQASKYTQWRNQRFKIMRWRKRGTSLRNPRMNPQLTPPNIQPNPSWPWSWWLWCLVCFWFVGHRTYPITHLLNTDEWYQKASLDMVIPPFDSTIWQFWCGKYRQFSLQRFPELRVTLTRWMILDGECFTNYRSSWLIGGCRYASAFFLTIASFQSTWGKAYKYFPLKPVFLIGIGVFELGSLICGKFGNLQ